MNSTALADLFGSRAAEAVLLHLYHYGESYGRAISKDFAISLDSVQRQLEKFSGAGVLVSKSQGRTLLYSWNAKSRLAARLKDLVAVIYDGMSIEARARIFATRRRPRAKGKSVTPQSRA